MSARAAAWGPRRGGRASRGCIARATPRRRPSAPWRPSWAWACARRFLLAAGSAGRRAANGDAAPAQHPGSSVPPPRLHPARHATVGSLVPRAARRAARRAPAPTHPCALETPANGAHTQRGKNSRGLIRRAATAGISLPQLPHPARPRTTEPPTKLRRDPMCRFRAPGHYRRLPAPLSGRQQALGGPAAGPKPGRKTTKSAFFLPSAPRHPRPEPTPKARGCAYTRTHPCPPKRVQKQGRARQTHLCAERNQIAARKRRGFLCQDSRSAPAPRLAAYPPSPGEIPCAVFDQQVSPHHLPTLARHSPHPTPNQGGLARGGQIFYPARPTPRACYRSRAVGLAVRGRNLGPLGTRQIPTHEL